MSTIMKHYKKIAIISSFLSFLFLLTPSTISGIFLMCIIGTVGSVFLCKSENDFDITINVSFILKLMINLVLLIGLGTIFFERWFHSSIVRQIARFLHLSSSSLLYILIIVLSILANYFFLYLLENLFQKIKLWDKYTYLEIILIIVIFLLQWIQIQYSVLPTKDWGYIHNIGLLILNITLVCIPNYVIVVLTGNWIISLGVSSMLYSLFCIINYYVLVFHGTPIATSELANLGTAINVVSGYRLFVDKHIIFLIILFITELLLLSYIHIKQKKSKQQINNRYSGMCLLILSVVSVYIGLFSPYAAKPEKTIGGSWEDAMMKYGYCTCLIEDFGNVINPYIKPEGYDVNTITGCENTDEISIIEYPDIILILNETFFDLNIYVELEADCEYMNEFYQIEDAVHGYAVTPSIGGGTNNSEYELLTSNSMSLLRSSAPFNYVDLTKSDNNVVRYLESFGYQTFAMHCLTGSNYSRNSAYPELGFDKVFFEKDFVYQSKNGERVWLDSDNYKDMFELCKSNETTPRFMYLLTIQNHGDFEQNEDSYDTVHVKNNFGNRTDDINEYLSSIKLSCDAFVELTESLKKSDRPTIVCMVGDHAPFFISELNGKKDFTEEEKKIYARMTPYIIWANYDIAYKQTTKFASMVDIVPMLVEAVGFPLTDYYRYILDMHEVIPVRTSDKLYMDSNNTIGSFENNSKYYDLLRKYYYMEYNSLIVGSDYRKEWFIPMYTPTFK